MLYIFYGPEDFIIQKQIANIFKKALVDKESVVKKRFGKISLNEIINDTDQVSLFATSNFVVADDFDVFLSKKQINKEAQISRLIEFSNHKSDSILILVCNKDKIPKDTFISKLGEYSEVIECKKLATAEKRKIITTAFKNREMTISSTNIDYFIKRSGMSIRGLISEVEKMSLHNQNVTKEVIEAMVEPVVEKNIFSLVESILKKDIESSMNKYQQMVEGGTSPVSILTLVGNETALMLALISAEPKNIPSAKIAAIFKKPAFVISKAYKNINLYQKSYITRLVQEIAKLEQEIKTGKIAQNASSIQFFIYKMIKGI